MHEPSHCTAFGSFEGLEAAVNDYLENHRLRASKELRYFSNVLPSDEEAVRKAALALMENGKRHPHQYRIPGAALKQSEEVLLANVSKLRQAESFDELIDRVEDLTAPIPGIGELTIYDTAIRIGARFGHSPRRVYLHAGTRLGAIALGFDSKRASIAMDELPESIRKLSAREAEDFLCIYKDHLAERSLLSPNWLESRHGATTHQI